MRRFLFAAASLLCVCAVCLSGCAEHAAQETRREIHAVWVSYPELSVAAEADGEQAFRQKAAAIFPALSAHGIDTAFVCVRPFSDALYRSDVFPFSALLTGTQGEDPGCDPLEILCAEAKKAGVHLHAWINPFRICSDDANWTAVAADNPAKRFLSDDDPANDHCVVFTAGGVYYDPASPDVQALIVRGAEEILQRYDVDGIHIDDYFYPSQDETIDEAEYAAYRAAGGNASLGDWRRAVVSAWVRRLYRTVKQYGDNKIFSISPAVNLTADHDKLYADAVRWCREGGFCDWIIPQVYVGFEHETCPFANAAKQWDALVNDDSGVRLLYGLAAYKCGQPDEWAGAGRTEWVRENDILSRQIAFCRTLPHCDGFAFFSFSCIFGEKIEDHAKKELQFVTSVL